MKLQRALPILSIVAGLAFCQTAFGQFDRFLDNIGNQARQEFGRAIQDAIPNVMPGGGGHQTLPVDPPTTVKPPVYPPVHPPSCGRPPVYPPVYPPVNPPVYPPVTPPVVTPPVVTPPTPAGPVPVPAPPATTGTIRPVLSHELGHVARQTNNLPSIETGDLVAIESEINGFGNRRGSVTLSLGGVGLAAVPVAWSPGLVRARLPSLPLGAAAVATVSVHNANSELVEQLEINLTPSTGAGNGSATSPSTASIRPASAVATPASASTGSAGSTGSTGISPETGDNLIRAAAIVPVAVSVGKLIWMAGDDFGEEEGTAKVSIGAMSFDADVTSWSKERAGIQLPNLNLTESVAGQIQLHRADGSLITTMDVQFQPRQSSDSVVRIEQ